MGFNRVLSVHKHSVNCHSIFNRIAKKILEHGARFSLTLNDLSMDLIDMSFALYAMSYQITSMFNQVPLTTQ